MALLILNFVFIGFIVSQFLAALNFFDTALNGYFSSTVIIIGCISYLYFLLRVKKVFFPIAMLPVFISYCVFIILFLCIFIFNIYHGNGGDTLKSHVVFCIFYVMMPILAYIIFSSNEGQSWIFCFLYFLFFVIVVFRLLYGDIRSFSVSLTGGEFQFNYQAIGATVVILYVFLIDHKRSYLSYVTFLVAFIGGYLIGARAEIISLLVIFILNCILKAKVRYCLALSYFSIVLIIFCGLFILLLSVFVSTLEYNLSAVDLSLHERMLILASNLKYISESPLLGNYSAYDAGMYAHNLISVWVDFGLVPFLVFNFTLFLLLFRYMYLLSKMRFITLYRQGLCIYISTLFLMLVFKDYGYFIFPFSIGIYFAVENKYMSLRRKSSPELTHAS
ncbi:hypothetical protein ACET9J_13635 [Aeromonas veronii]